MSTYKDYSNYTPPVPRLPEVTLTGSGKLYLTQEVMDQIDYLHKKVGGVEWCGILFYTKESGEIHNPEDFVLTARQIYPMNIGSEAYTEADIEGMDIIEMYEKIPNAENMKQGLIHTHHRMATFFSGTDMSELHDNAPLHNYYLSLIVNFDGKYTAKIAYVAEVTNRNILLFNNSEDQQQRVESETTKKVLVMMNLDIIKPVFQEVVPEYFQERWLFLDNEKSKKKATGFQSHYGSTYVGGGTKSFREFEDWEKNGSGKQSSLFNDEKKPAAQQQAEQKAKELAKMVGSGKIVNEQGKYISVGEKEMQDLIVDWLNAGLDVDTEMLPDSKFNNVHNAVMFYESFFEKNPQSLDYFLTSMQKMALVVFKDYSLKLIEKKGSNILTSWSDSFTIAADLANILDTLQQFAATIEEYKNDPRKQWDKYQKSY